MNPAWVPLHDRNAEMRLVPPSDSLPTPHRKFATLSIPCRRPRLVRLVIVTLLWSGVTAASVRASPQPPTGEPLPEIQSLSIEPSPILLHGSNRQQQLLVT